MKNQKGTSLIEIIIYITIIGVVLTSFVYFYLQIVESKEASFAISEVNQNINLISRQLRRNINRTADINSISSTSLTLENGANDIIYNCDNANKEITYQLGSDPALRLNSPNVEIECTFTQRAFSNRTKNVKIDITASYIGNQAGVDYSRTFTANYNLKEF